MKEIKYNEFDIVDLRSGTIIKVEDFPEAKNPSYKITVDFWEWIWVKQTSAQITILYNKNELVWKQIIWVINLWLKQIWHFMSEFLLTWFVWENWSVTLAIPDKKIENGIKLS